jgi:isopentenyl-diphosphate delta-isomerase
MKNENSKTTSSFEIKEASLKESIASFEARKAEHIEQSLDVKNQAVGLVGLNKIRLDHEALPELDFEQVSLQASVLGQAQKTPFLISSMTAGHAGANQINMCLAEACARRGWILAVGSQRRELFDEKSHSSWTELRERFPDLALIGNLGLSQVIRSSTKDIRQLLDNLGAKALFVHTNPLQEALQVEGTPQFAGGEDALRKLCEELGQPVILKEVGTGFSRRTLERLRTVPLGALDVSGLGGTHWGRIEGARADSKSLQYRAALTFADWGVPTWESLQEAMDLNLPFEIWASGGVRSGLDAAKLLSGGAEVVGFAQPALEKAVLGVNELLMWMEQIEFETRVACFCTGSREPKELRGKWTKI